MLYNKVYELNLENNPIPNCVRLMEIRTFCRYNMYFKRNYPLGRVNIKSDEL